MAFRSVPRPSSPPGAKASTECPSHARDPAAWPRRVTPHTAKPPTHHAQEPATPGCHHPNAPPRHTAGTNSAHTRNRTRPPHPRVTPMVGQPATVPTPLNVNAPVARPPRPLHRERACRSDTATTARPATHQNLIHPDKDHITAPLHAAPRQHPTRSTAKPVHSTVTRHALSRSGQRYQPIWPEISANLARGISRSGQRYQPVWRRSDSNRRPPACKAGALPVELRPLTTRQFPGTSFQAPALRHQLSGAPRRAEQHRQPGALWHLAPATWHLNHGQSWLRENNHGPGRTIMGQGGLEPPTPRLSSVCSNQLSYWPAAKKPLKPKSSHAPPNGVSRGRDTLAAPVRAARSRAGTPPPTPPRPEQGLTREPPPSPASSRQPQSRRTSLKGGDPAAGSPTATLLRLHPSR